MIVMARELLRDPYWPIHVARVFGEDPDVPAQYRRAY
jgi:2,4-dienoyl-CoA reductase-like NADH-dependent reductase (Old Yellow Enzyme family)